MNDTIDLTTISAKEARGLAQLATLLDPWRVGITNGGGVQFDHPVAKSVRIGQNVGMQQFDGTCRKLFRYAGGGYSADDMERILLTTISNTNMSPEHRRHMIKAAADRWPDLSRRDLMHAHKSNGHGIAHPAPRQQQVTGVRESSGLYARAMAAHEPDRSIDPHERHHDPEWSKVACELRAAGWEYQQIADVLNFKGQSDSTSTTVEREAARRAAQRGAKLMGVSKDAIETRQRRSPKDVKAEKDGEVQPDPTAAEPTPAVTEGNDLEDVADDTETLAKIRALLNVGDVRQLRDERDVARHQATTHRLALSKANAALAEVTAERDALKARLKDITAAQEMMAELLREASASQQG